MLREIKHQFMAFRNGIVADSLRNAGYPYGVIFGLQLPQISEIARSAEPSTELADALWKDRNVRESRILACYLFPVEKISLEKALELVNDLRTREEADILTFRLLRHLPFKNELKSRILDATPEAYIIKALERFEDN